MITPRFLPLLMAAAALLGTAVPFTGPFAPAPAGQTAAPQQTAAQPDPAPAPRRRDHRSEEVRGLYITSWIAGMKRFREIADGLAGTGLNALVIDTKDCTGKVGYDTTVPLALEIKARERRIRDLNAVVAYARERNIYTIARIAVFQDPVLAAAKPELAVKTAQGEIWTDNKGQTWVDPASRKVWEYNLDLAREAASRGFDEIQFDYVRFPTDGRLKGVAYPIYKGEAPKHQVIREFFQYLDRELKPLDVIVSADVFGLTTVAEDDLNIGQRIVDLAPYVDFLCPMVYPSHYPAGYLGFKNPAEQPYKVVYDSCMRGLDKLKGQRARLRPWIQDFDLGARYDRRMIFEQIQALRDAGAFGFCAWNARNVYTIADYAPPLPEANPHPPLRDALVAELEKRSQEKAARTKQSKAPR